ncbi:DUF2339 domain-containing protein [Halovivax cerinus]|uniref:DUF2339 domain-containing protein n=1 Tax=Halovivax cerinus TaxID=1487865 RepID=A0ABD5NP97_9EURY|nr:DUF2339 domain-containing protein [Halovivax cerinus]
MTDDDPDLRDEVRELRAAVDDIDSRLSSLESAIERPAEENRTGASGDPADARSEADAAAAGAADAPSAGGSWAQEPGRPSPADRPADGEGGPVADEGRGPPADAPTDTDSGGRDWELDVGIRWLGVVGVLALLVGVGLFVRYAIQQDLLGYAARIALGVGAGAAMVAVGRYAARDDRYHRLGGIVVGGGLAIAALSLYAAYGFESYRAAIGTTLGAAVAGLTAVVAVGLWISHRDDRPLVGAESLLIGYLTAGVTIPEWGALTLAYALVLTIAVAAVSIDRDRPALPLGGVIGSYGVYVAWRGALDGGQALAAGAFLAVAFGTFLATAIHPGRRDRTGWRSWLDHLLVVTNALAFATLFARLFAAGAAVPRSLTFLSLAVTFAGIVIAADRRLVRETPAAPYLAVGFYALAVDLALAPVWVTIVLAASLPAALLASIRLEDSRARLATHGLALVLVAKVALPDAMGLAPVGFDPWVVPTRLVAFLAAIAACYGVAVLIERRSDARPSANPDAQGRDPVAESDPPDRGSPTGPAAESDAPDSRLLAIPGRTYAWVGTALVTELLWLELSSYPLSVAWAAFALALLAVGFVAGRRSLRYQGIALLGLTTVKVFLVDTSGLDPLTRTLSFLTLGAVLLVAAFAYARNAGRLGDSAGEPAANE